ncbi:hypothetical protein [Borrelia persica]|uniref:hypothetical protein n=1 Tax=Borrelia persica TaxID=44448 RepID=UPI000462EBB9|nr:hypothetical protein [Borrelia persica]
MLIKSELKNKSKINKMTLYAPRAYKALKPLSIDKPLEIRSYNFEMAVMYKRVPINGDNNIEVGVIEDEEEIRNNFGYGAGDRSLKVKENEEGITVNCVYQNTEILVNDDDISGREIIKIKKDEIDEFRKAMINGGDFNCVIYKNDNKACEMKFESRKR